MRIPGGRCIHSGGVLWVWRGGVGCTRGVVGGVGGRDGKELSRRERERGKEALMETERVGGKEREREGEGS